MLKKINFDESIICESRKTVDGRSFTDTFVRTDFLADEETDITAMNTDGSEYLKYPSGSMVYCIENGKKYILKADCSEYVEV